MEGGLSDYLRPAKESVDDKHDVLNAAKEALIEITKKFSLDIVLMSNAALNLQKAIRSYSYVSTEQDLTELKEVAVHVVEEALSEKGMHTPDIMKAFEDSLDDKLPTQRPLN